jgi:signal transduction histidine kinase/CheY-like chemotaxis protein
MSDIQTNKYFLFKKWRCLRLYNIVILNAFLFFYAVGTLQSYRFFKPPVAFNLALLFPLSAVFLCAYLIHCLIAKKDKKSTLLLPVLTLFTTLFVTINCHFETEASENIFLYFTLLLPLFYAYILSYNFKILVINNLIVIISYTFIAVVGDTSTLVFISNLVFLFTLVFLTIYSDIKNINYASQVVPSKAIPKALFNKQNASYLKSVIHDIRQPLSSLSLYGHLLNKQIKDTEQSVLVDHLLCASNQLDRWISSLLELASLDSKSLQATVKNIPIQTCLSTIIKKQNVQAKLQDMILKVNLTTAVLYTDTKLLSDIIDSLINNALIHGVQGKGSTVLLTARQLRDEVNIQVWNKGPRISNEHLNSLFDELYYPNNPNHNKAKGLGLGLALSQRKALLLNTKISVKTSDNGSCFSIKIPKGIEATEIYKPAHFNQQNIAHILLIDDDKSILGALSMLLENWGYKVDCAENSEQAISALENNHFSLIISDYRLPGEKNGIDLIKIAQQKQGIPSVLLTGEVDPDKLKAGEFRSYKILQKPIKPATLRLLLRHLITVK